MPNHATNYTQLRWQQAKKKQYDQKMNNEKWNEICFLLSDKNFQSDLSETEFKKKVIQALRILDWKEYKGEIEKEQSLQFGSVKDKLRPDFIIKSENKRILVIEVKLPNVPINSNYQRQLFSYMRQVKLEYGILIGQGIQVFYDGDLINQDDPILLETLHLTEDSEKGQKFVELFSKESYSAELLKSFTLNSLKKINRKEDHKKLIQKILSDDYQTKIIELIKQDFLNEYDGELIDNVLQEISVNISSNLDTKIEEQKTPKKNWESNVHQNTRDKTKYIINGNGRKLAKNRFVLELVREYLKKKPTDFKSLKNIFLDEYQGSTGVINTLDSVRNKYANRGNKRHFIGQNEILVSADNVQFVVCTEWRKDNVDNIVDLARKNGFEISEI